MSEENVENLRRGLDAFNRGDRAAWLAVCDPECENVPPREWPESARVHGADAIWDFCVDHGADKIVAHQRAEMRGKASGAGVVWSYWVVFTFRDGKVLRFEWFADRANALEAAGLQE